MKVTLLLISTLVLFASGCASYNYVNQTYSDTPVDRYIHRNKQFRIYHKPEENKLMITPTFSSAIGQGIIEGITLNSADMSTSKAVFQPAVEAYLKSKYEEVEILDGYKVLEEQWEFIYRTGTANKSE
jgi:hypothetical protein